MSDVTEHILNADIVAFQEVYKRHFNIELDEDTARRKLTSLVRLTELICKPAACALAGGHHES